MNNFKFYALTRFKLDVTANNCLTEVRKAHGDAAPSRATVFRWFSEFKDDENTTATSSDNEDTARGGDCVAHSPRTSRTPEMIRAVQQKISEDNRMTVRKLATILDLSKSTVHRVLTEDLKLRNVCSVWVPHNLTEANKQSRVNCAKHIRRLFFAEKMESFCNKLAVQDETLFHLEALPTKQQNRCWLQEGERRPQVVRRNISSKKVMLLVVFTPSKRFSISAVPPRETVNSETL